jgi:glycosyltransferase involved in cell wall biosynthesis
MSTPGRSVGQKDLLFVQSTTEVGGAEVVLLNLLAESAELRRRSLIATLGFGHGDLPLRLRELGVEVVELKFPRLRHVWELPPLFKQLRDVARHAGVRAVMGNGAHPQIVAGLVARLTGARAVFLAHNMYRYPLLKNDPRDIAGLSGPMDLVLGVSRAAQASVAKLRPNVPSAVMYNGTPIRDVAPDEAARAREELGATPDEVLIGVFGRLQRWKGQDVFVAAAGHVARARPKTKFAVVGGSVFGLEPEFAEELRRRATSLSLSGRITFTGGRNDVPRLMAACDIICHTSREPEAFGMVILEAMAQGRAVIATGPAGPAEIVTPTCGILVQPDDPNELARAIENLVDDGDKRRQMGIAGRERALRDFSMPNMVGTFLENVDRLIGAR